MSVKKADEAFLGNLLAPSLFKDRVCVEDTLGKAHEREPCNTVLKGDRDGEKKIRAVKTNLDVDIDAGASVSQICVEIHIESVAGVGSEREMARGKRGNVAHELVITDVFDLDHSTVSDHVRFRRCRRLGGFCIG